MKLEHNMILLAKEHINIPVRGVNAQVMLIDCLKGNARIDQESIDQYNQKEVRGRKKKERARARD